MSLMTVEPDELVDTPTAAEAVFVHPATIRSWKAKGLIKPSGLNQYGHPMYRFIDILRAEQKMRKRGMPRRKISRT